MQVTKWLYGKKVGGYILIHENISLAVWREVSSCAVELFRNQPTVNVIKVEPRHRMNFQVEVKKRRRSSGKNIRMAIGISPLRTILHESYTTPIPTEMNASAELAEITSLTLDQFTLVVFVILPFHRSEMMVRAENFIDTAIAQPNVCAHVFSESGPGLSSNGTLKNITVFVVPAFSAQQRIHRHRKGGIAVIKQIQTPVPVFANVLFFAEIAQVKIQFV